MNTKIIEADGFKLSNRHGIYGGMAGDKDGLLIDNDFWIAKYPKNTQNFKSDKNLDVYTTSPLSEYIGSHIFEMLGFDTHKTYLGHRNNKIVVLCKDFCTSRGQLTEIRTLKNAAHKELSEKLETELRSSATGDSVDLPELLLHLQYNPLLKDIPGIIHRFWEQAVVDIFIDNNDRNNGNWGILFHEKENMYSLAPVYDNGNSFMNKTSEERINALLNDKKELENIAIGTRTCYMHEEHILSAKKFFCIQDENLAKALIKIVPKIKNMLPEICNFIDSIPEEYAGCLVCSKLRKEVYKQCMELRLQKLLVPAYEKNLQKISQKELFQIPENNCKNNYKSPLK